MACVLADVKEDASLRTIPTLILSISDAEADIAKVYYLQGELLPHQTSGMGRLPTPREEHQGFLADNGQAAAQEDARLIPEPRPVGSMRSGRVATSEQEGAIAEKPGGMEGVGEAGGNAIASDTDRHPRFGRAFLCDHSSLVLTSEQIKAIAHLTK